MIHWGVTGAAGGIKCRPTPVPRYKLARQAMLVIKRFRGRTLRIRNVAKECQLSRKVGYKMTRARKKI